VRTLEAAITMDRKAANASLVENRLLNWLPIVELLICAGRQVTASYY
jgi:hypothetical protein